MEDNSNSTPVSAPRTFKAAPAPVNLLRRRGAIPALIGLFLVLAIVPDLTWPSRKSYFATYTCDFKNFTVLHPVLPFSLVTPGGGGQENYSTLYMSLLRLVYRTVAPQRQAAMRVLSVLGALLALGFLSRIARDLFSPAVAAVFLFLLVTSPIYLESMRAFGYQSLSHLAVVGVIYCVLCSRQRLPAAAVAAVFAVLTLSLYVTSRAVLAVPLLFWGVRIRSSWKRILLFLIVFVLLAAAVGAVSGQPPLGFWRYFIFPEEQAGLWPVVEEGVLWDNLHDHLRRNLDLAAGYLLNFGRTPFADRDSASRLFNLAYTPFLFLGLAGLWRRRGDGAILVLLLLGIFFLLPLASREIQPRRILLGIYPIYLLIVLGMAECYRWLRRQFGSLSGRWVWVLVIPLLMAAGWDVREYLLQVSRPRLDYPRPVLRAVAGFVEDSWSRVDHIRYYKEIDELVMGNPYFARRPGRTSGFANIFAEEGADLRGTLDFFAREVGGEMIYLYTDPPLRIDRSTLDWARKRWGDDLSAGPVPGAPGLFFLRVRFAPVPAPAEPVPSL